MFNIKQHRKELIDAKKKDLEYNTHDFTVEKGELLIRDSFKPISSIFMAISLLLVKTAVEKGSIAWFILTSFSIAFCIKGLYFLAKSHALNKELASNSPNNKHTLDFLFEKAYASNNKDFQTAISKIKNHPTDIEVQALLEYSKEKGWT